MRKLVVGETDQLGKYLGFLVDIRPSRINSFNFSMDKIIEKLTGWRASMLLSAGRIVLINLVISAMPSHIMQCTSLPTRTCNAIDRICRNFLWGSTEDTIKIHLVNWETVTLPREEGGLGITRARERNLALLGSLAWRTQEDNCPWARILRGLYGEGREPYSMGSTLNRTALHTGV